MVDTPREGRADWAAIYAALRRPKDPTPPPRFVRRTKEPSASSSGPHRVVKTRLGLDEKAVPQDRLHEGAVGRMELGAWLRKFFDAGDNHTFKLNEKAEIRREIEALHVEVGTLTELNRQQQKAVEQLLAEVQRGSEEMGRKDWVAYAIGVATSLVIMEIVPPLALLPLAVHAVHALGHLLIPDA